MKFRTTQAVKLKYVTLKKRKLWHFKTGPKRIAKSTGKPDQRARDNKNTPGNTPSLKPPKTKKKVN